jgi:hypothetical protein
MEGDGPTGALVLPNYFQTIVNLKRKEESCERGYLLQPMYHKMITKLEDYQDEALECETLIMATLLHPTFRLKIFAHCWPEKAQEAEKILTKHFEKREKLLKNRNDIQTMDQNTPSIDENDIFTKFNCPSKTDESKELEVYIKNMDRLPVPDAKDLDALLPWWKVFFYSINLAHYALVLTFTSILGSNLQVNSSTYPVLASLARDFLCSSGSSCAAERTFSSAADVCSSGRGSLKPKTIE